MTGNVNPEAAGGQRRSRYARVPDEFAVHLLFEGGHREEVRFPTIQEFQKWYSGELVPKSGSNDFITIPIKNLQGEYMVARPAKILAIRVEPVFASSIDRTV
ncbi:MAG: hypothetical protein SFW36_02645 [Leptolyngbyaceae cyanobacterium bins.59]|nr:hypothetical protein [Leptolyngbyaceae cyanobacterium bins.59]